jgi:hypothetical protein
MIKKISASINLENEKKMHVSNNPAYNDEA